MGEQNVTQENDQNQETNLPQEVKVRKSLIQELYYRGAGKPIYAEFNKRKRISATEDSEGSSRAIEITERNIAERELLGVAIPTGDLEHPYVVIGGDMSQFVFKVNRSSFPSNTLDMWFDIAHGEGLAISNPSQSIEQQIARLILGTDTTIISGEENPDLVERKIEEAKKFIEQELQKRMETRLKLGRKVNDIFRNFIPSDST